MAERIEIDRVDGRHGGRGIRHRECSSERIPWNRLPRREERVAPIAMLPKSYTMAGLWSDNFRVTARRRGDRRSMVCGLPKQPANDNAKRKHIAGK